MAGVFVRRPSLKLRATLSAPPIPKMGRAFGFVHSRFRRSCDRFIPGWMHRARNESEISTAVSVVAMGRPSWKLRASLGSPPIPQMGRAVGSCSFHSRFKCSCDRFIAGCMHRASSERSRHGSNVLCSVSNLVRPRPG